MGVHEFFPLLGVVLLGSFDKGGGIRGHMQLWTRGGPKQEIPAGLCAKRLLVADRAHSEDEREDVQSDEGEGDDGPPSSAHVFVAQGEHGILR